MMLLITGGASCGKSALAEAACMHLGVDRVYLAAMRPFGEEGRARVRKHRAQRAGKGFDTIECFEDFAAAVRDPRLAGATALLECLGNVVANEMFGDGSIAESEEYDEVVGRIAANLHELTRRCEHVVVVGNEVGCDGVAYDAETRRYQEILGGVSCRIASEADMVVECVAGVPQVLAVNETAAEALHDLIV